MARPRKPADRRVDNRSERGQDVVPLEVLRSLEPPDPPAGLLKPTREWWEAFWRSELAAAVSATTDLPAVSRLASLLDERERCYRSARKGRLVEGSQGQPVLNPLYKHMATLDSEIRQLEDRFGLTPRSRVNLGIQVGQLRRSLDDLNAEAASADVGEYLEVVDAEEGSDARAVGGGVD